MAKIINCDCGFVVVGESDDELVANAQAHARDVHDMDITREQVLSLAVPAELAPVTVATAYDEARAEAFVGTVLTNFGAAFAGLLTGIGDKLGLFKDLAGAGPATSVELAERTGIDERYAREWLAEMQAVGYLELEPVSGRYSLPAEHVPVLAQERGEVFFGGAHQMLLGLGDAIPLLVDAFRNGGGVPQSAYGDDWWDGMARFTASWFENLLLPVWIPAMPDVQAKLEGGCRVADVGCGTGLALVRMAQAYPRSTFVGYDLYEPWIERARILAKENGVDDRLAFETRDVSDGLPERFDVITTFDVIHDAIDPKGILRGIHTALEDDGIYVCLDINCSERTEENTGPLGTTMYGFSVLYCMTTSLAHDGEGLGTCGFHPQLVEEYCKDAGFSAVRQLPLENPFNNVYEVRA
jgi:2-polyprenyl-3-methyl-5-hydroxy-6-metoxy-1,4-benzoquinol methylase